MRRCKQIRTLPGCVSWYFLKRFRLGGSMARPTSQAVRGKCQQSNLRYRGSRFPQAGPCLGLRTQIPRAWSEDVDGSSVGQTFETEELHMSKILDYSLSFSPVAIDQTSRHLTSTKKGETTS